MAQRAFTLPIRALSQPNMRPAQWICKRCLATQSSPLNSSSSPSSYPLDQRRLDESLSTPLAHSIPVQYLQHSTSDALHPDEQAQREKSSSHRRIVGVVVSAGRMHKTVKVRIPGQEWNKKIGKYFSRPTNHLVHDPNSSLIAGDVVELHRLRVSTIVHHVVASIVTPFSTPISERPPIPTPDERLATYKEHRFAKLHRRELREKAADGDTNAIEELRSMGLDPGKIGESSQSGTKGPQKQDGKINARAQKNKEKAMRLERQAESNLLEAKEIEEDLRTEEEFGASTIVPKQGPNVVVDEVPQVGGSRGT